MNYKLANYWLVSIYMLAGGYAIWFRRSLFVPIICVYLSILPWASSHHLPFDLRYRDAIVVMLSGQLNIHHFGSVNNKLSSIVSLPRTWRTSSGLGFRVHPLIQLSLWELSTLSTPGSQVYQQYFSTAGLSTMSSGSWMKSKHPGGFL